MATITEFEEWLEQADPDDHEEVYALFRALTDTETFGPYECILGPSKTMWFVKAAGADDTLLLASEKARTAFISLVEQRFGDGELDMESWYHFHRNLSKDD